MTLLKFRIMKPQKMKVRPRLLGINGLIHFGFGGSAESHGCRRAKTLGQADLITLLSLSTMGNTQLDLY